MPFSIVNDHYNGKPGLNPLERSNKEIKRRTVVVGILPNRGAEIQMVDMVPNGQHDERQVNRRYLSTESLAKLRDEQVVEPLPALVGAA